MVLLGFGLDVMHLQVSGVISLALTALSPGLRAPGAPKMTPCPLNVRICLIVNSMFYIPTSYGPAELCFGYDALLCLGYYISRAHGPFNRFKGHLGS